MGQKRDSSGGARETEALHETFTAVESAPVKGSGRPDTASIEARKRRANLIVKINASWSETSERALAVIAEQCRVNARAS